MVWLRCGFLVFIVAALGGCVSAVLPPTPKSSNLGASSPTVVPVGLPPKQCENQPGTYIFIANGPATRPETEATRPQLNLNLVNLMRKEFTSAGSRRATITRIQLTELSHSNPQKEFELTCIESEPTLPEPQKLEDCRAPYIGTEADCVKRNEERERDYENRKKKFVKLKERIQAGIDHNKKELEELQKDLEIPTPVFPTLDIWGGLGLASVEVNPDKRPSWRRLVVVIAEDEKEGPGGTTHTRGCCNLKGSHFIFAGLASNSLKEQLLRRGAWDWWIKNEAGTKPCFYVHNEGILSLWECPDR